MKTFILDRDGVINLDSPHYIKSVQEWHPIPNSLEAIAKASQLGFKVFVASNQSGLARGYFDEATLTEIHALMISKVKALGGNIDGIVYCSHGPDEGCQCRKPRPGLLYRIRDEFHIDLSEAVVIGDSYRDLEAAFAAEVKAALVRTGNGEKTLMQHPTLASSVLVFDNLHHAISHWITPS